VGEIFSRFENVNSVSVMLHIATSLNMNYAVLIRDIRFPEDRDSKNISKQQNMSG
jgi:hypothetical protein